MNEIPVIEKTVQVVHRALRRSTYLQIWYKRYSTNLLIQCTIRSKILSMTRWEESISEACGIFCSEACHRGAWKLKHAGSVRKISNRDRDSCMKLTYRYFFRRKYCTRPLNHTTMDSRWEHVHPGFAVWGTQLGSVSRFCTPEDSMTLRRAAWEQPEGASRDVLAWLLFLPGNRSPLYTFAPVKIDPPTQQTHVLTHMALNMT